MVPIKTIQDLISKHSSLEKELSSGQIEKKQYAEKSKEYSDLNDIIKEAKQYSSFDKEKKELEKILNDTKGDNEFKNMAKNELEEIKKQHESNEKKLKLFLLPKDDADKKNAIIEIRAGTGGLEASLFAADLFKMYEKVSHKKKWKLELISISKSDAGGLKEVLASIKGKNISIKYCTQVHHSPPIFAFFTNQPNAIPAQYKRYMENSLRDHFGFEGVPIKISFRKNK